MGNDMRLTGGAWACGGGGRDCPVCIGARRHQRTDSDMWDTRDATGMTTVTRMQWRLMAAGGLKRWEMTRGWQEASGHAAVGRRGCTVCIGAWRHPHTNSDKWDTRDDDKCDSDNHGDQNAVETNGCILQRRREALSDGK
jgi:hypothetical protein